MQKQVASAAGKPGLESSLLAYKLTPRLTTAAWPVLGPFTQPAIDSLGTTVTKKLHCHTQ